MNLSNQNLIGWTAIAGGVIGVIGFISLCLLFMFGEPFGTINDVLSIPSGILLLPLVFALYRLHAADHSLASLVALLAGVIGFLSTAIGSILLVSGRIDFDQSLLTGIGGFGLIGLWVLLNSVLGLTNDTLPRGAAWMGLLLGITPTLALFAVFRASSIANALEGMAGQSAGFQMNPLLIVVFMLGALSYAGLPFWFILMGRLFLADRLSVHIGAVVAS